MIRTRLNPTKLLIGILALAATSLPAFGQAKVVISQVYGGGGNSGSVYKNDFIELFNSGDAAQNLSGWSVQYASSGGGFTQVTNLSGTLAPGHYYLVQEAVGAGGTTSLPTPEASGAIPMSATAGKVALSSGTTALSTSCASAVDLVAYGSGASCFEGTTFAPGLGNTTSDSRIGSGCTDSNQNTSDFTSGSPNPRNGASAAQTCIAIRNFGPVVALSQAEGNTGTTAFAFTVKLNIPAVSPVSFNATTANVTTDTPSDYTALVGVPFTISATQQAATVTVLVNGDTTVESDENFSVTLSSITGAFPITPTLSATGTILNDDIASVTLSFSPTSLPSATEGTAYSQTITVVNGDACSFSTSGTVPPGLALTFTGTNNTATLSGTPSLSGSFGFTVSTTCSDGSAFQNYTVAVAFACESGVKTSTPIHAIQGSGTTSPLAGQTVEVEGIVVGVFNGTNQLRGFYLQEPDGTWDSDPSTSEGIFIFDNSAGIAVAIGDRVRVRGTVAEFSGSGSFLGTTVTSTLTEIGSLGGEQGCSTGNGFTRTTVTLPTAAEGDLEHYEGMAVQISQQLTVTGNFGLGQFSQLDLAPSLQYVPTNTADPVNWVAKTSLVKRSVIALDDFSTVSDPVPTLYPAGGLSGTNTLRDGWLVNYDAGTHTNTPLIGVLDDRFGEYRIQPTSPVTFYGGSNPRPDVSTVLTATASRFRASSANVLNFFTTLGSRGAANATQFQHQKTKIILALNAMNADVYGLTEVQNYANGQPSGDSYTNTALQSLVDGLNCAKAGLDPLCTTPPSGPYALINTLILLGSNGTDAIRPAIIYNSSVLTAVGNPAMYYQNDTNRPSLAQTFKPATGTKADQQTFTFVVNHFRSKGSACGVGSDDPIQGNCNGLRLNMAQNVVGWLAGNPTGDPLGTNRRLLLVGDFNAYFGEDPIQYFANHGYPNLINAIIGPLAYSYNFGSQAGYLDHTMANSTMNALVKSVAEWHTNADEPGALQATDSFADPSYYAANPYAASDHDPFVVGFNTLPGDLNDDGIVSTADGALVTASFNKSASAVDRRMDYDGDGKIGLNDYRIWTSYYATYR